VLWKLDEQQYLEKFHHIVIKKRKKYLHYQHIKNKLSLVGYQLLLLDIKYLKHLGKLQIHCLGPFYITEIRDSGAIKLAHLNGIIFPCWVNGAHMKPYYGS